MNQETFVPLLEVVRVIELLAEKDANGTLFLGTRENQYAQVALQKGKIVFVHYQGKRGQEALSLLSKAKECRYRFQNTITTTLKDTLPPLNAILEILGKAPAADSKANRKEPADLRQTIPPEKKEMLRSLLAEYVGPVAAILVEEHCQPGNSLLSAVNKLAEEIPDSDECGQFRKKADKIF